MIVAPTQKLYFNRFTHCIKINFMLKKDSSGFTIKGHSTIRSIKDWLAANSVPNRTRVDWYFKSANNINVCFGIYLNDEAAYETLIKDNQSLVQWASKPASDLHKNLLLNNTEIEFREKLFYNRFRYKISFNTGWRKDKLPELSQWVKDQFHDRVNSRTGDYLFIGGWTASLYLKEDSDVLMAKLCQSEIVTRVIRLEKFSEHGMNPGDSLPELAI